MKTWVKSISLNCAGLAMFAALAVLPVSVKAAITPSLTLSCADITIGRVGAPLSAQLLAAGGTTPYTFGLSFGVPLPPGLMLNALTGVISGIPTASGGFLYFPNLTDAAGAFIEFGAGCPITIASAQLMVSCSANTATVGVPYGSPLTATGGVAPYTFSVLGALPTGLTLSTVGLISGTPTVPGNIVFTAQVVDSTGNSTTGTATQACTMVVAPSSNACGLSPGYWKNHASWPVSSLVLGDQTYNKSELLNLLGAPKKGDSSLILAFQLIAAKLNVANGTNAATAGTNIAGADLLLSGYHKKLPYGVKNSQMETIGSHLDLFNADGVLQPGCTMPQ